MKKIYYLIRPLIPRKVQLFFRRLLVKTQAKKSKAVWPVLPGSEVKPKNWSGWPDGKEFAFVLTHDVELRRGHDRCKELLELEKKLGFKSSFNFVAERYKVDRELREFIVSEGFEVGIHGIKHDGKKFKNKKIFDKRAKKINEYIKEWNIVGFRAPAVQHNLEWIGELDIEYDSSTFDTDPFEPQPDGVSTIYPFMVERKNEQPGYVELPYTLDQDFTLFILMKETTPQIWIDKLNWISKNGGMALVIVHPDYVNFNNEKASEEYPVNYYADFLKYVKENYEGKYWNALPKEVAKYYKEMMKIT